MDTNGYNRITQVFIDEKITGLVLPYPFPGEHSEHVTVNFDPEQAAASLVLNALGKAGLYDSRGNGDRPKEGPYLRLLFGASDSMTFLDTNNGK